MKTITSLTRMLTALSFSAVLFLVSCKKEASDNSTPAEKEEFAMISSEADAEADVVFDDVFNNVIGVDAEVGIGGTGVFGSANTDNGISTEVISGVNGTDTVRCFTVTYLQLNAPNRFPLQVTLDFGAGCEGRDGRTRKGKIMIVYSGPLFVPGKSATTTFDGYYVNDIKVEGTHRISNTSTQSVKSFRVEVIGAKLTKLNGNFTQWNSDRTLSQIEGLGTPLFPLDDVLKLEGSSNGSVKKGDRFLQWSAIIQEPLIKKFTCRWIAKGVIILSKSNSPVAELNYGTGNCDNKATLSVNGQVLEITLH
ncbi:MAG: hypothetical protein H7Y31_10115 [Chitinophagaceae bacterium]|nr:hypothetical protein [Chitinophagaceae bacterium]